MIATVCLAEFRRWNPVILIGNCTAGSFVGWKFPTAELTQVQIMQIQRMEGARFENYFVWAVPALHYWQWTFFVNNFGKVTAS